MSTSTTELEYIPMSHGVKEGVYVQKFLNKFFLKQAFRKMQMLGANKTSLTLTNDLESQNQTNHIDVIYHHIRELVEDGEREINGYLVY